MALSWTSRSSRSRRTTPRRSRARGFEAAGLDAAALSALLALRSASILSWTGAGAEDLVTSYHDRIRQSVIGKLDDRTQRDRHLALGRVFASRCECDGQSPWLFDAVR